MPTTLIFGIFDEFSLSENAKNQGTCVPKYNASAYSHWHTSTKIALTLLELLFNQTTFDNCIVLLPMSLCLGLCYLHLQSTDITWLRLWL